MGGGRWAVGRRYRRAVGVGGLWVDGTWAVSNQVRP